MNVLQAIHSRHSYRGKFLSTPVPREDLIKIMEAGLGSTALAIQNADFEVLVWQK